MNHTPTHMVEVPSGHKAEVDYAGHHEKVQGHEEMTEVSIPDSDDSNHPGGGLSRDQEGLHRELQLRHMVMIAISGTIGTGLFLTSGKTIATAGPGGAMLAYALIGLWLVFVCQAIGEVSTLLPLPGAFNSWAERVFDPALSFTMTWMYFINWALTIPAELSAAAVVVGFWLGPDSTFPQWVVPLLIIVVMIFINLVGVKAYGEMEYWFSIFKVLTIIMFIICGILVDTGVLGGVNYGVSNWHIEGAPFKGGIMGFLTTLVSVGYAYGGTEMTGVTAAESRNPHKHVPKAVNTVLVRIAFFYLTSIFLLSCIVPNDDPRLLNPDGTAAGSPFTIVFLQAGINGAANFMNAVVFTSIFSAINSDFYLSTRMLLSLSRNNWAPKFIGRTNSRGVPYVAVGIVTLCSCLSLITVFVGSGQVFSWFVSIIGSIIFQSWFWILVLHFRFRQCWSAQGKQPALPYMSWGYPIGNIVAMGIACLCIGSTCYLSVINPPSHPGADATQTDMDAYTTARNAYIQGLLGAWFPWVLSAILYIGYKFAKGTKFISKYNADLTTGMFVPGPEIIAENEADAAMPRWKRILTSML